MGNQVGEETGSSTHAEPHPGPAAEVSQQAQSHVSADASSTTQLRQSRGASQQVQNGRFEMAQAPQGLSCSSAPGPSFNMGAMANALPPPDYQSRQYNYSTPNHLSNMGQMTPMYQNGHTGSHYGHQHQQQFPQAYHDAMHQQQPNPAPMPNAHFYGDPLQPPMVHHQPFPHVPHYATQWQTSHQARRDYPARAGIEQHPGALGHNRMRDVGDSTPAALDRPSSESKQTHSPAHQSNVVRGPPRKPRQDDFALWVGGLPKITKEGWTPLVALRALLEHISKLGVGKGLVSIRSFPVTASAFVNYDDEASHKVAHEKLRGSKFHDQNLDCKFRPNAIVKGISGVTAPTGPAATLSKYPPPVVSEVREILTPDSQESQSASSTAHASAVTSPVSAGHVVADSAKRDRFFIIKSLTKEDLDRSVCTGLWATQSQNEEKLNHAFLTAQQTAATVWLIFSANKSSEYFGYAIMTSEINRDPDARIQLTPNAQSVSDVEFPTVTPTEGSETMPKGQIVEDRARNIIFWEAVSDKADAQEQNGNQDDASSGAEAAIAWGNPFKVRWVSTTRLPFQQTRALRNPWNSSREVKVARDGTEVEPSVGRRLIALFNQPAQRNYASRHGMGPTPYMSRPAAHHMGMSMGYGPPHAQHHAQYIHPDAQHMGIMHHGPPPVFVDFQGTQLMNYAQNHH